MNYFPSMTTRMKINDKGKAYLTSPVSVEEIKIALLSINDDKSPRPDGYSSKFYKLHWIDLQENVFNFVS